MVNGNCRRLKLVISIQLNVAYFGRLLYFFDYSLKQSFLASAKLPKSFLRAAKSIKTLLSFCTKKSRFFKGVDL